jgi:hypothetical protein
VHYAFGAGSLVGQTFFRHQTSWLCSFVPLPGIQKKGKDCRTCGGAAVVTG